MFVFFVWQSRNSMVQSKYHSICGWQDELIFACRPPGKGSIMAFDYEEWKEAIFAMCKGMIKANDLLAASGLIDANLDEQAFDHMLDKIAEDIAEGKRRVGKSVPRSEPE